MKVPISCTTSAALRHLVDDTVGVSVPDVVALQQWGRYRGYYEADWRTPRVLRHRLDGPPTVSWGFAARCAGSIVLLFRRPSDDHVVLHLGGKTFDLHERDVTTRYRSVLVASRLSISDNAGDAVASNFTPGRLFGLIDPARDALDDDDDDFLLFLHGQLGSREWADHARSRWGVPAAQGGE